MYTIYKTLAIVLFKKPRGEANSVLFLMTRDLGCVYASAQGVRALKSKLRYHLDLHGMVRVDLVRGKDVWRIISASPTKGDPFLSTAAHAVLARIAALVKRLAHGEEPNPLLFTTFEEVYAYVKGVFFTNRDAVELVAVLRILDALGYGPEEPLRSVVTKPFSEAVNEFSPFRTQAIKHINEALAASHL